MKRSISIILSICICLLMGACRNSNQISQLMNGFEWGQSTAQVGKIQAANNNTFSVCGKTAESTYVDYSEGGLSRISYTMSSEHSMEESQDVFNQLTPEYNDIKETLIQILGAPDVESEHSGYFTSRWFVGNDIVTLTLKGEKPPASIVKYNYTIKLVLEHT